MFFFKRAQTFFSPELLGVNFICRRKRKCFLWCGRNWFIMKSIFSSLYQTAWKENLFIKNSFYGNISASHISIIILLVSQQVITLNKLGNFITVVSSWISAIEKKDQYFHCFDECAGEYIICLSYNRICNVFLWNT